MLLMVVYLLVNDIQVEVSPNMARFIPKNALVYFEQQNASRTLTEFLQSPLGKKIKTLRLMETGKKIGLSDSMLHSLQDTLQVYASLKNNALFHKIFGKSFALAILAPEDTSQLTDIKSYLRDNTVAVAWTKGQPGSLVFEDESAVTFEGVDCISNTQYGNHQILRFQVEGQLVSVVSIEGFLVIGLNEKKLRQCIDSFDKDIPSLATKKSFNNMKRHFVNTSRFLYLPVVDLKALADKTLARTDFFLKKLMQEELARATGFSDFGYGSWNKQKSVKDKVLVLYSKEKLNNVVLNHVKVIPRRCSMLALSTENPMAFYWSNTIRLQNFLHLFSKSQEEQFPLKKFWSNVLRVTGKSSDEIFSLFGDEVSMVFEPGLQDTFFSFPRGILFLKIKKPSELRTILERLIDNYDVQLYMQSYGPIRYSYWTKSPQDGLQPLYGFWGDFVFIANSASILEMVVDRRVSKLTLLDTKMLKAFDPGFTEKNNSLIYLNNVEIVNVFKKVLDLIAMALAVENQVAAEKARTIFDEVIVPLLQGVTMYDRVVSRSYFSEEMVIIESVTRKNIKKK